MEELDAMKKEAWMKQTDFMGDRFVDAAGKEINREQLLLGYKYLIIIYTASWCGGCLAFKGNMKSYYEKWNELDKPAEDRPKNV